MNTVINHVNTNTKPMLGDIFAEGDDMYILAQVGPDLFTAINIASGNRFSEPSPDKTRAVAGLAFVARDAKIMINSSNGEQ
jgi:hypothetical protein